MGVLTTVSIGLGANVNTWSVGTGDPAEYGPLGGLTITQDPLDELWPPADKPVEVKLQLLVESYADVPHVRKGAVARVTIYTTTGVLLSDDHYRVADLEGAPHRLGVLLTLLLVDFTADLRDRDVTFPSRGSGPWDWGNETAYARLSRVLTRVGYAPSPGLPVGGDLGPLLDGPAESGKANAYDYVQTILRDYLSLNGRAVLVPVFAAPMTPPTTFTVAFRSHAPDFPAPLKFVYVDGQWSLTTADGAPGVRLIPAAALDFASRFAQTRDGSATRIVLRYDKGPALAEEDRYVTTTASLKVSPAVSVEFETLLTSTADRATLAKLYLPDEAQVDEWVADAFRYFAERDAPGTAVPITLGDGATVAGIPAQWNPTGRTWLAGRLARRVLTITGGQAVVEFQLRRPDFTAASNAVRYFSSVITGPGSGRPLPTYSNIDPTITYDELRLARGNF